jgi:glutamate dehydrogenase/leucine dehydrogenase
VDSQTLEGAEATWQDIDGGLMFKTRLNKQMDFSIGYSMYHIGRGNYGLAGSGGGSPNPNPNPNPNPAPMGNSEIARRSVVTGLFNIKVNDKFTVSPTFLYQTMAGAHDEIIVQGLGNVGYHSAKFFQENGALVVGLAEFEGSIYKEEGLDIEAVVQHRKTTGSILNFPGATNFAKNTDALEAACDILIPAALENVINVDNADKVQAKIIGEAANGPLTPEADEIFNNKGVLVVPDMYLNAGGVTVSYFEWVQNLQNFYWSQSQVESSLRDLLQNAFI